MVWLLIICLHLINIKVLLYFAGAQRSDYLQSKALVLTYHFKVWKFTDALRAWMTLSQQFLYQDHARCSRRVINKSSCDKNGTDTSPQFTVTGRTQERLIFFHWNLILIIFYYKNRPWTTGRLRLTRKTCLLYIILRQVV